MIKRKIFTLAISFFIIFSLGVKGEAKNTNLEEKPALSRIQIETKRLDSRAEVLSNYLKKYNSPLQYHAQDFVDAADQFGLDWKMLPAIAGVESTFGKRIPGGYNAYGWGAYDAYHAIYFVSWTDGIFTVARGIKEGYLDKGLADPHSMNKIYAASKTWGAKVSFFMDDLDKFSKSYKAGANKLSADSRSPKIAVVSGQLASN